MNNHCVVLTCTVNPDEKVPVVRNNPEIRLNDYVDSIIKWHRLSMKLKFQMLVIENSDSIEILRMKLPESIKQSVTFHQSLPDYDSKTKGISAGEYRMLKDSISVVEKMPGIDFCWKVTGRLFVSNFAQNTKQANSEIWVNRFYKPRHITDSRFFGAPFSIFSQVFSSDINFESSEISRGTLSLTKNSFPTMEDFLTRVCLELECLGWPVRSFNQIPIFEGVSASTGKRLDAWSTKKRLQAANLVRKLAIKMISGSLP